MHDEEFSLLEGDASNGSFTITHLKMFFYLDTLPPTFQLNTMNRRVAYTQ